MQKIFTYNQWTEQEIKRYKSNLYQVSYWTNHLSTGFDFSSNDFSKIFRITNPLERNLLLYSFGDNSKVFWTNDNYSFGRYEQLLELALSTRLRYNDLLEIKGKGKVLCFETCVTTHDSVPAFESNNFVDLGDVPPIDTWFYTKRNFVLGQRLFKQCLFCWIPMPFESIMQRAIDVEILDSYDWLDKYS